MGPGFTPPHLFFGFLQITRSYAFIMKSITIIYFESMHVREFQLTQLVNYLIIV